MDSLVEGSRGEKADHIGGANRKAQLTKYLLSLGVKPTLAKAKSCFTVFPAELLAPFCPRLLATVVTGCTLA